MSEIKYLAKDHIYMMHKQAIKDFGGDFGYYDNTDGGVESILAQQYPIFGFDKYPDAFQKAAMLMYFFTKGHCFVDGNKRVGIQSAKLSETERDAYINTLAKWLKNRFVKKRIRLKRPTKKS